MKETDPQADAKTTSEFRSIPVMKAASAVAPSRVGYAKRPLRISPRAFVSLVEVTSYGPRWNIDKLKRCSGIDCLLTGIFTYEKLSAISGITIKHEGTVCEPRRRVVIN